MQAKHLSRRCLSLFPLLLLSIASIVTAAVPPTRPPTRPLDLSKLPPNTIIVIGEEGKDALQQPGVIVLTPEKFREMLEQIDQLKKQASPDKAEAPSRCKISGKIEGDIAYLQLQYEFETRKRRHGRRARRPEIVAEFRRRPGRPPSRWTTAACR